MEYLVNVTEVTTGQEEYLSVADAENYRDAALTAAETPQELWVSNITRPDRETLRNAVRTLVQAIPEERQGESTLDASDLLLAFINPEDTGTRVTSPWGHIK